MKPHQYIFDKMSIFLKEKFSEDVIEYEEGTHLVLRETGFWISCDDKELTIGFGLNHTHYNFNFDAMEDAIDTFFLLLTERKKVTSYMKGSRVFKTKTEIELGDGELINLGTTLTFPLQFWKRTNANVSFQGRLLGVEDSTKEWKELIDYAQQVAKEN